MKHVTKVSKITVLRFMISISNLTACPGGFYGQNCHEMCNCIEEHQSRSCDRMNGNCHCLSDYTGLRCELPLYATTDLMEMPIQSNRAAIIAGVTVGSAVVLLLLIVVIIAVAVQILLHVHKTRDVRLKISPSQQQFENQTQLQKANSKPLKFGFS